MLHVYGKRVQIKNVVVVVVLSMKLVSWPKIKLRQLKEGAKHLMLSVEVPLCFTKRSSAKNPAGDCYFFSR